MPFNSCEELLETARYRITKGLEQDYRDRHAYACGFPGVSAGPSTSGIFVSGPSNAPQVAEVDSQGQPSQLQSDGQRAYLLDEGVLKIIDLTSGTPQLAQELRLDDQGNTIWGRVFVHGQQLLVIGEQYDPANRTTPGPVLVLVRRIDLSVPGQARIMQSWNLEGKLVDASQKHGLIRLLHQKEARSLGLRSVNAYFRSDCMSELDPETGKSAVDTGAHRDTHPPCRGPWEEALRSVKEHNAKILANLSPQDLVPSYETELSGAGMRQAKAPLFACEELLEQQGPQGVGVLSLLSFDLGQADALQSKMGIFGATQQTLLTDSSLYTAASNGSGGTAHLYLSDRGPRNKLEHRGGTLLQARATDVDHRCDWTYIDKFDLSAAKPHLQQSNARIQGGLMPRDAMSEYDGALRVAVIRDLSQGSWRVESYIEKLVPQEGSLDIAQTWPLPTQDGLYVNSVKFMGDRAYYASENLPSGYASVELASTFVTHPHEALASQAFEHFHAVAPGRMFTLGRKGGGSASIPGVQIVLSLFDVSIPGANKLMHHLVISSDLLPIANERGIVAYSPEQKRVAVLWTGKKEVAQGEFVPVQKVVILSLDPQVGFEEIATIDQEAISVGSYDPSVRMTLLGDTLWIRGYLDLKGYSILTGEQTGSLKL